MHRILIAALLAGAAGAQSPLNPSFEEGERLPSGWLVMEGARTAESGPKAEVTLDRNVRSAGQACLRFSSDGSVRSWPALYQDLPARPGERVLLTVAGRSLELRREGRQYRARERGPASSRTRGQPLGHGLVRRCAPGAPGDRALR